jgi:hypothetical protein
MPNPTARRPRCNRVTPFGTFERTVARGLFMGNRGILHDETGELGTARWRSPLWITCVLSWRGRHRQINAPGHYTELFFLDEAVALAAGHRPCAECRRADYNRFKEAWRRGHGLAAAPAATAMDAALHAARTTRRREQIRCPARLGDLPEGALFTTREAPGVAWLVRADHLRRWSHAGYGPPESRAGRRGETVLALTPEPTLAVLKAGFVPAFHPSAEG